MNAIQAFYISFGLQILNSSKCRINTVTTEIDLWSLQKMAPLKYKHWKAYGLKIILLHIVKLTLWFPSYLSRNGHQDTYTGMFIIAEKLETTLKSTDRRMKNVIKL